MVYRRGNGKLVGRLNMDERRRRRKRNSISRMLVMRRKTFRMVTMRKSCINAKSVSPVAMRTERRGWCVRKCTVNKIAANSGIKKKACSSPSVSVDIGAGQKMMTPAHTSHGTRRNRTCLHMELL